MESLGRDIRGANSNESDTQNIRDKIRRVTHASPTRG